jgi:cell division protein YceG involved in septum cleavage
MLFILSFISVVVTVLFVICTVFFWWYFTIILEKHKNLKQRNKNIQISHEKEHYIYVILTKHYVQTQK